MTNVSLPGSSGVPAAPPSTGRVISTRVGWAAGTVVVFVAILWALEGVDVLANHSLDGWGIRPRDDDGLRGIAFAPLLHASWQHLAANSVPALVLGFVGLLAGAPRFLGATAVIWIVSGVGVWLTGGTGTLVVGLSGVIFGWVTYLVARGLFTRKPLDLVIGLVLLLVYGGILWGVLPGQPGISWQAHLWGAVGGVIAAVLFGRRRRTDKGSPKSTVSVSKLA